MGHPFPLCSITQQLDVWLSTWPRRKGKGFCAHISEPWADCPQRGTFVKGSGLSRFLCEQEERITVPFSVQPLFYVSGAGVALPHVEGEQSWKRQGLKLMLHLKTSYDFKFTLYSREQLFVRVCRTAIKAHMYHPTTVSSYRTSQPRNELPGISSSSNALSATLICPSVPLFPGPLPA